MHEVIYKKLMDPLIVVIKDEQPTVLLLSCLYKCVQQLDIWQNPSKWNEVDDVLDSVMKRIPFETDNRCAAILYLFVTKLTLVPMKMPVNVSNQLDFEYLNRLIGAVEKATANDQTENYDKLRAIFHMHHNLAIARWSKKLMEIFTERAIIGHAEEIRFQIHVISEMTVTIISAQFLYLNFFYTDFAYRLFGLLLWKSIVRSNEMV